MSMWRKTLLYLGLVEEDELEDEMQELRDEMQELKAQLLAS